MRVLCPCVIAAAVAIAVASPSPAPADDRERAREAAAAGRILPLSAIVERAIERFGGRVLDVEYEDDDDDVEDGHRGRPHRNRYQVKVLTADGRILKLDYDAVTGDLVGQHGRHRERHRAGRGRDGDE